ncbi:tripartite tricarboxylate transporter substrate binding protein [Pigmentiphaga sp. H8]|nr:tripartite tricarboxylate transporter substrate binding protein [Pigmentiphaga sp. H8]
MACTGFAAAAQTYPARMVKLVVPFPPAGSGDVAARLLAERLGPVWGVPIVVENKPGAAAMIGADAVAKAAPDGYTLLVAPNNLQTMNPAMYKSMPFDAEKAFRSVALIGTTPFALVAGPGIDAGSVSELVALAKSRPGGLSYASSGVGSVQHLAGELFRSMAGVPLTHIPYKGGAPAVVGLLSGQVDLYFGAATAVLPQVKAGKLKPLAVTGSARTALLPGVPTMDEAGVKGYVSEPWIGLLAPAGTPDAVVARINRDLRTVMADPDLVTKLAEQGIDAAPGTPEALDRRIATERRLWSRVIAEARISAD